MDNKPLIPPPPSLKEKKSLSEMNRQHNELKEKIKEFLDEHIWAISAIRTDMQRSYLGNKTDVTFIFNGEYLEENYFRD